MTNLNIQPGQSADHESINTFDEFQQAFSYFFAQGVPGERFVANREVFHEFVKVAEKDPTAEVLFLFFLLISIKYFLRN